MGATGVLGAGQCVGVLPCRQPMHRQRFAPVALRQASARPCARPWAAPTQRNCRRLRRLAAQAQFAGTGMGLSEELKLAIEKYVSENKVVLFMKGNRQFPQCGFSNTCVQILNTLNVPYETVNILEDERLRSGMKEYSQWPTFPQVYIGGEFYGGCDIMIESYTNGELPEVLEAAMSS